MKKRREGELSIGASKRTIASRYVVEATRGGKGLRKLRHNPRNVLQLLA